MKTSLFLRRRQSVLLPLDAGDERELRLWPEDKPIKAKLSIPRRTKNHRHFFAVIASATAHWPEGAEPDPNGDPERLRAYLLCKAGYAEFFDFPPIASRSVVALMEKFRGDGTHSFVRAGSIGGEPVIRVFAPKSIAWDELDEQRFNEIKQRVFSHIEHVLGVPADQLVRRDMEAA